MKIHPIPLGTRHKSVSYGRRVNISNSTTACMGKKVTLTDVLYCTKHDYRLRPLILRAVTFFSVHCVVGFDHELYSINVECSCNRP